MKRPLGISIIAILSFIGNLLQVLSGLGLSAISGYGLAHTTSDAKSTGGLAGIGIGAVLIIISGVLGIIAAVGLWKMKSWAWYLAVITLIVNVVFYIHQGTKTGFNGALIFNVVIYVLFLLYFFSVRKHFRAA